MRLVLGILVSMIATQAVALSCMRPNPARTFNWLHESRATYHIVYGRFDELQNKLERVNDAVGFTTFTGTALGGLRLSKIPVTIRIECSGPWCGGIPEIGEDRLMFFEKTGLGYLFQSTACGGHSFEIAKKDVFPVLKKCLKQGRCSQAQIDQFDR